MILSYETLEPGAEKLLVVYYSLTIFSWIMTFMLYRRWQERQKNPPKWLFFAFLSLAIAILFLAIGMQDTVSSGFKREAYKFSMAAGYSVMMIANTFLIKFAVEIFSKEGKHVGLGYIVASLIVAFSLALPINFYGVPDEEIPDYSIRPYTNMAMVFLSIIIYTRIVRIALLVRSRVEEPTAKLGFLFIAISQFCVLFFFIFVMVDALVISFTDATGYTIFIYLAWLFAGLFFVFSYLGLIMPHWLRKHYEQTK